jgi:hypothetical protein
MSTTTRAGRRFRDVRDGERLMSVPPTALPVSRRAYTAVAAWLFASTLFVAGPRVAADLPSPVSQRTGTITATFRLLVVGHLGTHMTLWVAFGPAAGRFGLLRLRPARPNLYTATDRFPVPSKVVIVYLAGQGVIQTRFGPAPGNPVVTIERLGPLYVSDHLPVVRWRVPVG